MRAVAAARSEALEEAVARDHAAPPLASGGGAEEAGRRADAQEDELQEVVGDVDDAGRRPLFPAASLAGPSDPPLLAVSPPGILPHDDYCHRQKDWNGSLEIIVDFRAPVWLYKESAVQDPICTR